MGSVKLRNSGVGNYLIAPLLLVSHCSLSRHRQTEGILINSAERGVGGRDDQSALITWVYVYLGTVLISQQDSPTLPPTQ